MLSGNGWRVRTRLDAGKECDVYRDRRGGGGGGGGLEGVRGGGEGGRKENCWCQ